MNRLIKVVLLTFLLFPNFTFAHEHRANYRHRNHSHKSDSYFRTQQGWDISPRKAHRTSNCYYYTLYVDGGRGSARIISLPGKNYIQISNGQKEGYVCFNGPTTLELGKLSNPDAYVELDIDEFFSGQGAFSASALAAWTIEARAPPLYYPPDNSLTAGPRAL